jgi:DNA-binding transcriptional LysR family regulator
MSTLLNEKADICLGLLEKDMPFIQSHLIFQDEIVAIYHPDFQLQTPLHNWQDLSQEQLILTKRGYGIRQKIEQKIHQISPHAVLHINKEVSLISTLISLVQSGLGVGLVPLSAVEYKSSLLVQQHFEDPIFREISIFHLKEKSMSAAVQALIQHCQSMDQFQFKTGSDDSLQASKTYAQ